MLFPVRVTASALIAAIMKLVVHALPATTSSGDDDPTFSIQPIYRPQPPGPIIDPPLEPSSGTPPFIPHPPRLPPIGFPFPGRQPDVPDIPGRPIPIENGPAIQPMNPGPVVDGESNPVN